MHAMRRLDRNRVKSNLIGQSANQDSLSVFHWLGSYKALVFLCNCFYIQLFFVVVCIVVLCMFNEQYTQLSNS